jgi:hypothetical protein
LPKVVKDSQVNDRKVNKVNDRKDSQVNDLKVNKVNDRKDSQVNDRSSIQRTLLNASRNPTRTTMAKLPKTNSQNKCNECSPTSIRTKMV